MKPFVVLWSNGKEIDGTTGTMTVLNGDGWVVVPEHLYRLLPRADGADQSTVLYGFREVRELRDVREDAELDLVVGRLHPTPRRLAKGPRFARTRRSPLGEEVVAIGVGHYPHGAFIDREARRLRHPRRLPRVNPLVLDGVVADVQQDQLITTVPGFPRHSGSPVVDRGGHVHGILTTGFVSSEDPLEGGKIDINLTGVVKVSRLREMLPSGVELRRESTWSRFQGWWRG